MLVKPTRKELDEMRGLLHTVRTVVNGIRNEHFGNLDAHGQRLLVRLRSDADECDEVLSECERAFVQGELPAQDWRRARKADLRHLSSYDRKHLFNGAGGAHGRYRLVSIGPFVSRSKTGKGGERRVRIKAADGYRAELVLPWYDDPNGRSK